MGGKRRRFGVSVFGLRRNRFPVAVATVVAVPASGLVAPFGSGRAAAADPVCDRSVVLWAWKTGGPAVHEAAATALAGSNDAVCTFISTVWPSQAADDDRTSVEQM